MRWLVVIPLVLASSACVSSPAEERVRKYFGLAAEVSADTSALRSAILAQLPPGTSAAAAREFVTAHGVGRDGLSAYYPAGPGDTAVVRIEFDPNGWDLVAASYVVELAFDSTSRLSDVRVTRWLTGP